MKILTRYILREHVGPLIFALSALTALLLLNQVAKRFGDLVGKGLSWGIIGEFFLLSIPFIIAMTLPMAVLVAVLYAFSRLASENEVTALRASGVSVVRLVRPVLWGGFALALLMLLFNDQILPRANHKLRTLQMDIARKKPTFALREQVINEVIPGKIFLKTGHIDPSTNKLREVFIYNFEDPSHRKTIYADSGQMGLVADQSTLQMTLHNGYVIEIPPDNPGTLQRLYFTTDVVRVRGVANEFEKTDKDNFKSEREMTMCEMNAQYQRGARQLETARDDLEAMLVGAVRTATTGSAAPERNVPPPRDRTTSGALYCDVISRVFGEVKTAEAAEPPEKQPPQKQQPQKQQPAPRQQGSDARGRRKPADVAPRSVAGEPAIQERGAPSAGHAPAPRLAEELGSERFTRTRAPEATVGQINVIRSRITDARSTMSRYQVEIQKKFALAAACVVFVLFGAPIALRFPRGGVGLVIGASLVAFALYYVCLIAGETLADKLILSPIIAMWLANVIFTIAGLFLLVRVQRSGATARGGDASEMIEAARTALARLGRRFGIRADRRRRSEA
ncbi:MAG TPA: LptF/LptG family permease [Gemmatimonadaceae bacterium]|nr:LptF/LptG family permease [Gemmatimonadaceae bacterium]